MIASGSVITVIFLKITVISSKEDMKALIEKILNRPDMFFAWKSFIEIAILWIVIYRILAFIKGTKAMYLLRGVLVLLLAFVVFDISDLFVLKFLLAKFLGIFVILIIVIFQPELREALARLGKGHLFFFGSVNEELEKTLREIVESAAAMSRTKTGALIAIEREIGLKTYADSGVPINADLSSEMLQNIFYPLTPLHDGGVIVGNGKIVAAACLFPLSESQEQGKILGMRHRAGMGISETTDAVVVIVSEETGRISLAINGQLSFDLTSHDLLMILKGQFSQRQK